MKIAIIGVGNMGGAIARGLCKGSIVKPEDIVIPGGGNNGPGHGNIPCPARICRSKCA